MRTESDKCPYYQGVCGLEESITCFGPSGYTACDIYKKYILLKYNCGKKEEENMGVVSTIDCFRFPKQSNDVNRKVEVCFKYNTAHKVLGTIIRDDMEEPGETLIQLDDGRIVRSTECQYKILPEENDDVFINRGVVLRILKMHSASPSLMQDIRQMPTILIKEEK